MEKKSGFLINIYLMVAVVHVFLLNTDQHLYTQISKGLIIPILVIYAFLQVGKQWSLLLALFFSWIGDILLIRSEQEIFFFLGLLAFLIAHISYLVTFKRFTYSPKKDINLIGQYVGLGIYLLIFLARITSSLDDMLVPVYAYTIAIAAMVVMAIRRKGRTNTSSYNTVLLGAVLFVFSDSMIAWNTFYSPIVNAKTWIMLTYVMAQYLIVQGLIWHKKIPQERD